MFNSIFWKFRRPIPKAVAPGMRQRGGPWGLCHLSISEFSKICHLSILAFQAKKGTKKGQKWGFKVFLGPFGAKFFLRRLWRRKIVQILSFWSKNVSFFENFRRLRRRKPVTYRNFSAPSAPKTCHLSILGTPFGQGPPIASLILIIRK